MFDIFNRKKIKELEERLERTNDRVKVLDESLRVCERIIKYAKDEPSWNLQHVRHLSSFLPCYYIYELYLYIDREEYIIRLDELENFKLAYTRLTEKLSVDGNIAIFLVESSECRYKFTIDYKAGKYICVEETIPVQNNNNPGVIDTIKCGEEVIYDSSNENISNS